MNAHVRDWLLRRHGVSDPKRDMFSEYLCSLNYRGWLVFEWEWAKLRAGMAIAWLLDEPYCESTNDDGVRWVGTRTGRVKEAPR